MSYYSDDDDVNIRVTRRRGASPPHDYDPRRRPMSYYPGDSRPHAYLVPENRTMVRARSRSRERRRSPSDSPPAPAPAAPVIINNRIYNEHSDDDDDYRNMQMTRAPRRGGRSEAGSSNYMTREEYEMERTRQQLEEMKMSHARDRDDRRVKGYRDEADLQRAKQELDEIKAREQRSKDEARVRREMELERLREEEREAEENERREKAEKAAVEKYKQKELQRIAQEKKEREEAEKEYQRRMQEQLIKSGLDEKAIEAILKNEKVPVAEKEKKAEKDKGKEVAVVAPRPTYTRMLRKYLSIETLRVYHIDFDYDENPEYIIIKRPVPDWEQDKLWWHTRELREHRSSSGGKLVVDVGEKKRHRSRSRGEPQFEWVRKKDDRKRSKSPAPPPLLAYLAGVRPA